MPAEVLAAFGLRDGNRRRGHHRRYDSAHHNELSPYHWHPTHLLTAVPLERSSPLSQHGRSLRQGRLA
jgi:hypothetical protein